MARQTGHGKHRAASRLPRIGGRLDPDDGYAPAGVGRVLFRACVAGQDMIVAFLAGMMLIAVLPALVGWRTTVVVSGSMTPGMRPGDVVVAAPVRDRAPVTPGTVVLVDNPAEPGELLMHRLVGYQADGRMILKGDANADRDSTPVPLDDLRGRAVLRIPAIGLPVFWLRERDFLPAAAAAVLLAIVLFWRTGHRRPRTRRPAAVMVR